MVGANSYLQNLYHNTLMGAAWFSWYDFPSTRAALVAGEVSGAAMDELSRRYFLIEGLLNT